MTSHCLWMKFDVKEIAMVSDAGKNKKVDLSLSDDDVRMIMGVMMMVVVMSQLLAPLFQQSQAQTQALQAQAFVGNEDPRTIPVTNILSWINLVYDYPFQPWISAYFINDGPSAVEIGINYPDDRFVMNPRETITVTRSGAEERIKAIYFICRPGLNASVRVTGVY